MLRYEAAEALMSNERLINMFLWRLCCCGHVGQEQHNQHACHPAICSTERETDTLRSAISDINHCCESEIGTESCWPTLKETENSIVCVWMTRRNCSHGKVKSRGTKKHEHRVQCGYRTHWTQSGTWGCAALALSAPASWSIYSTRLCGGDKLLI